LIAGRHAVFANCCDVEERSVVADISALIKRSKPSFSQYDASKHALRALADSLRAEVNESGVRVLSIFLGRTASEMQEQLHDEERRNYRPELLLQPQDVASAIVSALMLPRTAEITDIHVRPMIKS
jgi:NADP-dependent 3-hydroxy acid dehydrogenase YdfG